MSEPKVLFFDLESAGVNSFCADLAVVVCFGYKFLGEKESHVLTIDQYPNWFSKETGLNDRGLLTAALKLMQDADVIVAHYGERFDVPFFQGRCLIQNLIPPPPTKLRDTWRIARTHFKFFSNRLANIADHLKLNEKKMQKKVPEHWPGWWQKALAGNKTAIAEMGEYCRQDVNTLEQVYLRLRPYDKQHPRLYLDGDSCGSCGGAVQRRGWAYTKERRYRRWQCKSCRKWGRDSKSS